MQYLLDLLFSKVGRALRVVVAQPRGWASLGRVREKYRCVHISVTTVVIERSIETTLNP